MASFSFQVIFPNIIFSRTIFFFFLNIVYFFFTFAANIARLGKVKKSNVDAKVSRPKCQKLLLG